MISCAAVCPSPPLLIRELTGRTEVLPQMRQACAEAIRRLLASGPDLVVALGADSATGVWDPEDRLDLSRYAPIPITHGRPGLQRQPLPLPLGVGTMLLDAGGHAGPRVLQAVGEAAPTPECLHLGVSLASLAPRVAVLAVGDGSARRSIAAPGHLDPRSADFDASVEQALRGGEMAAVTSLDPGLAADLLATGRAAWQVLAGAVAAAETLSGDVLYADAPFGVGYFVAVLS